MTHGEERAVRVAWAIAFAIVLALGLILHGGRL
jgi:hypothetical protein